MSSTTLRFSRIFPSWRTRQLVFSSSSPFVSQLRSSSSDSKDKSTVFPVGSHLIFAWHPKQTVPYEHTKPVPRELEVASEADSPLKLQLRLEDMSRHYPTGPSNVDLQNMFYTNKHIWYPKNRRTRVMINAAKKTFDRRGL